MSLLDDVQAYKTNYLSTYCKSEIIMKIAVFGATGIAGRAIVDELLSRGINVTVLIRYAARGQ